MRGGGLGSRPKKMYGDVVKYHLRRGVGFMKFLENGSRPQPPTSLDGANMDPYQVKKHYTRITREGNSPASRIHGKAMHAEWRAARRFENLR